jgi:hypothetical protein
LRAWAAFAIFVEPGKGREAESDPRAMDQPRAFFVPPTGLILGPKEKALI